ADRLLPAEPVGHQVPAQHRFRGRAAAPSYRQALQAPAARPLLAGPREQDRVTTANSDRGDVSRLMLFFAIVYVVEGIGQARVGVILQRLTSSRKRIGGRPLRAPPFFGVLTSPGVIKPLYGLFSDFVPLFAYRRTSYLMLASAAAAASYAAVALLNDPTEF